MKVSKTHHVTKQGTVKKNPTKDEMKLLKQVLWFEWLARDYPDSQIQGILVATDRKDGWYDDRYLQEKRHNIVRHIDGALENFIQRMKDPELRKKFEQGKR
jgi:hypothetical protein